MITDLVPRFMLAAPSSGSGKTTITCALLAALKQQGKIPVSFKCGPDYIDPMFHAEVLGINSSNLDIFLLGEENCKYLLCQKVQNANIAVIEGVMGYYDGVGSDTLYSSYHLASLTKTPVIIVIDCQGLSLTAAALIKGLITFRTPSYIKGVILNQVSPQRFPLYKEIIEQETGVTVVGYLPSLSDSRFESRHLGLITAAEIAGIEKKLQNLAAAAVKNIDFDQLFSIASGAEPIDCQAPAIRRQVSVTVAVAKDQAFCFYYQDALDLLSALGADLVYFSPLTDKRLPECDGLILGGGYPELYLEQLSANKEMLGDIKRKTLAGIPYLAECGGFMYLLEKIRGADEVYYNMTGLVEGEAFFTRNLQRFGYINLVAKNDNILCRQGESIHGHEFHYSDSTNNGSSFTAGKINPGGMVWDCIVADEQRWIGYPHIHMLGNIKCAENFLRRCEAVKNKNAFQAE